MKQTRNVSRGVAAIIAVLTPLYRHTVIGAENAAKHEDGSKIFICNHGEIYGPVVSNLFIPGDFRPWVLSRMMEPDEIMEHMYYGTMERQRWLPECCKRPLIRLIAPFLVWLFKGLRAIPVYRGRPKDLLKTFRLTLDAMAQGDNILIFPENADEHEEGKSGFLQEGVGAFYTGFAMLAPMVWAKLKKKAVFIPVYACKKQRVLTIGEGIVYNPAAPINQEKLRLAEEIHSALVRMAAQSEENVITVNHL